MKLQFLVIILFSSALAAHAQDRKTDATLYRRMGGYDVIATITDAYLKGVRGDPSFGRFAGRGADSLRRARQFLKDQFCAMAGGPCVYVGRDMKTVHGGLGITPAEWATSMRHLAAALDAIPVKAKERAEFLAMVDALKGDFVE